METIPVTTSTPETAEKTLSTLLRLKTFLKNRTRQERLVGPYGEAFSVHRDIEIDTEEVIKRFSNTSRKIKLV